MALARVAAAQNLLQVRDLHAGVALSGGDGGVAQDLLNLADVGPALQQVRGAGMAKPVRAHTLGNARALSIIQYYTDSVKCVFTLSVHTAYEYAKKIETTPTGP